MADIVNLNRARKAKAGSDAQSTAAANRVAHGRTKAERQAATAEAQHRKRDLDGAKREP